MLLLRLISMLVIPDQLLTEDPLQGNVHSLEEIW